MITRVVSAVIAAALIIGVAFYFKAQGVYAICTLIVGGCIFEYSKLTLRRGKAPLHFEVTFMIAAALAYASLLMGAAHTLEVLTIGAIVMLAVGVVSVRRSNDLGHAFKLQSAAITGLLYVGIFPGCAVALLGLENGLIAFFSLLAIVFAGDTFAYFAGRFFGQRKLLEAVSPKKTIAGSVGGLIGSALIALAYASYFKAEGSGMSWLLVGLVTGGFAQVGDLFESLIKRLADVKDSGRIMPGHGGLLDRLDGVIFAAPVYYILLQLLN